MTEELPDKDGDFAFSSAGKINSLSHFDAKKEPSQTREHLNVSCSQIHPSIKDDLLQLFGTIGEIGRAHV